MCMYGQYEPVPFQSEFEKQWNAVATIHFLFWNIVDDDFDV